MLQRYISNTSNPNAITKQVSQNSYGDFLEIKSHKLPAVFGKLAPTLGFAITVGGGGAGSCCARVGILNNMTEEKISVMELLGVFIGNLTCEAETASYDLHGGMTRLRPLSCEWQ